MALPPSAVQQPVPVALVGLNHPHAAGYLRILAQLAAAGQAQCVACYDADPELRVQRLQAFDAGGGDEDYEAMLAGVPRLSSLDALLEHEPAAAIVLQPNREAPAVAGRLVDAGVDVLVDKPAARTAAQLAELAAQAHAAGVRFTSGYMWRRHPAVRQLRRWLAHGWLGAVMDIEARLLTSHVGVRGPHHYLFDERISGGGMLHWLGVHWLDLMLHLMDAPVTAVTAEIGGFGSFPLAVEEQATVLLRFAGGAGAVLHTGYVLEGGYDSYFALRGTLGRSSWRPMEQGPLHLYSRHPHWQTAPRQRLAYRLPGIDVYAGQLGLAYVRDFLLGAGSGEEPQVPGAEAVPVLELVEAAYRSAAAGRRVVLEPGEASGRDPR